MQHLVGVGLLEELLRIADQPGVPLDLRDPSLGGERRVDGVTVARERSREAD